MLALRHASGWTVICDDAIVCVFPAKRPVTELGATLWGAAGGLVGGYVDRKLEAAADRQLKKRSALEPRRLESVVEGVVGDLPKRLREHVHFPKTVALSRQMQLIPKKAVASVKLSRLLGMQVLLEKKTRAGEKRVLVSIPLVGHTKVREALREAGFPVFG